MIVPDADLPAGERIKIVDFGIAKLETAPATNPDRLATGPRAFIGTLADASPEQCRTSTTLDGKLDVYSLGVILFELLSGELPFAGSPSEVLGMHISVEPRPLGALAAMPSRVSALVGEMLAKPPQQRPTMAAVRDRIDALSASAQKPRAALPLLLGVALIVLIGVAILLYVFGRA